MKKTPPSHIYSKELFYSGMADPVLNRLRNVRHRRAMVRVNPKPGEVVLDIGCGRGEIVRQCIESGAQATGVDYSQAAVEISRDMVGQGVIVRSSATCLPFGNETFDKVCLFDVLEHLDEEDANHCIREVARVLRPEGTFFIHTPSVYEKLLFVPRLVHESLFAGEKIDKKTKEYKAVGHVNVQSPSSLRKVLRRGGFEPSVHFDVPGAGDVAWWKRVFYTTLFFACPLFATARKKQFGGIRKNPGQDTSAGRIS